MEEGFSSKLETDLLWIPPCYRLPRNMGSRTPVDAGRCSWSLLLGDTDLSVLQTPSQPPPSLLNAAVRLGHTLTILSS